MCRRPDHSARTRLRARRRNSAGRVFLPDTRIRADQLVRRRPATSRNSLLDREIRVIKHREYVSKTSGDSWLVRVQHDRTNDRPSLTGLSMSLAVIERPVHVDELVVTQPRGLHVPRRNRPIRSHTSPPAPHRRSQRRNPAAWPGGSIG